MPVHHHAEVSARRDTESFEVTPSLRWLLHQRVLHAQRLLETTSLGVEEVAR